MTCRISKDGSLTICGPQDWVELFRTPVGIKWCFKCRKHLHHDWIAMGESGPSYYEPNCRYDCEGCHEEHVLGFGRIWDWQT